jgi:hypothetical protein
MSGIGSFLGKLSGLVSRGIGALPGLIGKGVGLATRTLAPGVRKVGEVAGSIARGIGEQAPAFAKKIGSFAGKVAEYAPKIASTIESGAKVAGEIGGVLEKAKQKPEEEVEGADVGGEMLPGGARMGYNKPHISRHHRRVC